MRLIRTGSYCTIDDLGDRRDETFNYLDKHFSYRIEGAEWSDVYQSGFWDGRAHLLKRSKGTKILFPAGLWNEAVGLLMTGGFSFDKEDRRVNVPCKAFRHWIGHIPADHQREAADAALRAEGGILKIAIRGGKTLAAARVAFELKQRTLFVVPSNMLLEQTARAFRSYIEGPKVTCVGGGADDASGDVVVASIQSLARRWGDAKLRKSWFMPFSRSFGLAVIDELHHGGSQGRKWREALHRINAMFRLGLSATIDLDRDGGLSESDVELHGICGKIVANVTTSELIERNWLVRPTISFRDHGAPRMRGHSKSPFMTVYKQGITACSERNTAIAVSAIEHTRAGRRVLIDYWHRAHGRALAHLIRDRRGRVNLMDGSTETDRRERMIRELTDGSVPILVSNVMGEGVDVPALEVVSNAEGGKAFISTIQRLRNLTQHSGKTEAWVDEWIDDHHSMLEDHMKARWAVYRGERAFRLEMDE